jgi:hypothetical protein
MSQVEQLRTINAKKAMLETLPKNRFNISKTLRDCNVGRATFYQWLENDEEFKSAVYSLKEEKTDIVEDALMKKIEDGDTTSIIFYLKTQAKDRGYIEKVQTEHSGEINMPKIELVLPSE